MYVVVMFQMIFEWFSSCSRVYGFFCCCILKKGFSSHSDFKSFSQTLDPYLNMNSWNKLVHEIEVIKSVIDMLELWLNKAKKAEVVRDQIIVVEPSGGSGYKKTLFKNFNPKR